MNIQIEANTNPEPVPQFIIYHANCNDGFGAAWAAWKRYGAAPTYLPVQYGDPIPKPLQDVIDAYRDRVENKIKDWVAGKAFLAPLEVLDEAPIVHILDFTFPLETMQYLGANSRLLVIDHHKTTPANMDSVNTELGYVYSEDQSAAVLAWRTYHALTYVGKDNRIYFNSKPVPLVLLLVQDRDLWRFNMTNSKALNAYISSIPHLFDNWDQIDNDLDDAEYSAAVTAGRAILRTQNSQVEHLASKADSCLIGGHLVPVVNSSLFISELGNLLCSKSQDQPFACVYFDVLNGKKRVFSLRSIGDFDVSEIAKRMGGGGHKNAAAFSISFETMTIIGLWEMDSIPFLDTIGEESAEHYA